MAPKPPVLEATQLVREGRVKEATSLLSRAFGWARRKPTDEEEAFTTLPELGINGSQVFTPRRKPDDAQFQARTFAGHTGARDYKLFVPARLPPRPALLLMLHGCTQGPDDFAAGTRMNTLAEEAGMLVAYPEQAQQANPSRCWNWFNPGDQQRGLGEPAILAGITRQVIQEFGVDPRRVFAAGLSAGGAKAAILGQTYPELFAAVGVHSGLACGAAKDFPTAFAAMRKGKTLEAPTARSVRAIVLHGDRDATVHPRNGELVAEQARAGAAYAVRVFEEAGPDGVMVRRTRHTGPTGRSMLEHWLVRGGGHAWFGGSPAGSFTEQTGPDASREMLRFFFA